jgi:hypothetical protein
MNHVRLQTAVRRLAMVAAGSVALAVAIPASAAGPQTCKGTAKKPGVLAGGTYKAGVVVSGTCEVNAGKAHVEGALTLEPKSALVAAFALNDRTHHGASGLTVTGDVIVGKGATLIAGCSPREFACIDDMTKPTKTSPVRISGKLTATSPLGVDLHNATVGASITQTGGGGGVNCNPQGIFKLFKSPAYSAYEDSTVAGNIAISNMRSCWLGVARVHVGGALSFTNDKFSDGDAIEILSNRIGRNLVCKGNSSVWDSAETTMTGEYPRMPAPNKVHGKRSGQCKLASPATMGGPSGPGPF